MRGRTRQAPASVAIHGSCVTRDVFSRPYAEGIEVATYVARHATMTAVMPPLPVPSAEATDFGDKPWRTRMGHCAASKSLFDVLEASPAEALIVDLMDDCLPLVSVGDSVVTRSQELDEYLSAVGFDAAQLAHVRKREAYAPRFWEDALDEYAARIRDIYDVDRIVLHEAYHTYAFSGARSIRLFGPRALAAAAVHNRMLRMKYRRLECAWKGCEVIRIPFTLADASHKWGLASNHYSERYYERFFARLTG